MNGDCWSELWRQDGNLKGCNGRTLQIVLLGGAIAVLLFFTSAILLFLSLCCTVCKIRQLKRILRNSKGDPSLCNEEHIIEMKSVNLRKNSLHKAPPIRLSLDRPMLDLPRQATSTSSQPVRFPMAQDDVPNSQLGVYDLLTHDDNYATTDRAVELQNYSKLNLDSEYAQVCEEKAPSPPRVSRRCGSNTSTPAMFYSDLVERNRDSQLEDDGNLHKIVEL